MYPEDITIHELNGVYYARMDGFPMGGFGATEEEALDDLYLKQEEFYAQKRAMARLLKIPGVGESVAHAMVELGVQSLEDLGRLDPDEMYEALSVMLSEPPPIRYRDTFASAIAYAQGKGYRPWWEFTRERKAIIKAMTENR